jgi:hypothetical protein
MDEEKREQQDKPEDERKPDEPVERQKRHVYGGFIDHVSDSFWFSAGPGEGMF